jgi:hypothetical protein
MFGAQRSTRTNLLVSGVVPPSLPTAGYDLVAYKPTFVVYLTLEGAVNASRAEALEHEPTMSELDRIKEQIAYLKYWQGIMVVTDITLVGWLLTAGDNASPLIFSLAIAGVIALTLGIVSLHRQIERRIERIGSL